MGWERLANIPERSCVNLPGADHKCSELFWWAIDLHIPVPIPLFAIYFKPAMPTMWEKK